MERVKVLIDKLALQQQQKESADAMLITTQLLQNELLLLQRKSFLPGSSKVSVVMPLPVNSAVRTDAVSEPVNIPEPPAPAPVLEKPSEFIEQGIADPESFQEAKVDEIIPESKEIYVLDDVHFDEDEIEDIPTLAQYTPYGKENKLQKEINELISANKETLNDKLKEDKKELGHVLKETPIRDLRKAIGINDRFVFVNELFRGDESMYERSIKTINGFQVLPEAEHWIDRELKVKLGWNDYKESVQHFYQLVRRRFS